MRLHPALPLVWDSMGVRAKQSHFSRHPGRTPLLGHSSLAALVALSALSGRLPQQRAARRWLVGKMGDPWISFDPRGI
jgi:hypothetical protein